jgi:5,10-methylenetetrahydromethanopterin reductase
MALTIGLNRWDWRSPSAFVASVVEAEALGIDHAFLPVNPLAVSDPYVLMALAAQRTSKIRFGPLLETPVLRSPAVAAGSIATVDAASDGRAMLVYGIGDTAVRWLGKRPARLAELERATSETRALLAGDRLDVGAGAPAWLRHARPVPVWVASSGPKSLRAAGRSAVGVFMRVGTHPANVRAAVDAIRLGEAEAGRRPGEVSLGLIVHTCRSQEPSDVRAIIRAMAAGFYEYAPALFDAPGFEWNGTPIDELKEQLWPDFHHAADLVAAGGLVDFLPDEIADSFAFHGTAADVADQLGRILNEVPEIEIVVPHPVPMPIRGELNNYMRWLGEDLRPRL